MNTTITIRTNANIKAIAQERAKELGISLSDVINNALRRFAKGEAVVYDDDNYSKEYTDYLHKITKQARRDAKAGKLKSYTGDEFIELLNGWIEKNKQKAQLSK
jgi:antitoxin component of RelBE/YafQ-DinJ toxin-antitoxin module